MTLPDLFALLPQAEAAPKSEPEWMYREETGVKRGPCDCCGTRSRGWPNIHGVYRWRSDEGRWEMQTFRAALCLGCAYEAKRDGLPPEVTRKALLEKLEAEERIRKGSSRNQLLAALRADDANKED